jgi:hypothetical protein
MSNLNPLYFDKEINIIVVNLKKELDSDIQVAVRDISVNIPVEGEESEEERRSSHKTESSNNQDESGSEHHEEE